MIIKLVPAAAASSHCAKWPMADAFGKSAVTESTAIYLQQPARF